MLYLESCLAKLSSLTKPDDDFNLDMIATGT